MTVLTPDGTPVLTPRGSVLSSYLPKRRALAAAPTADAPRERVPLRARLRANGRAVKDFLVAGAAFACADVAAFHWHPWAGWLSVGLSLVLVDHAVDRTPPAPDGEP
ncbi:MAG TPA: hypothetical protein VFQ42_04085 [Mycobacterium sp.]|nr:hypothetical protein [Mycobacterium sp.]